MTSDMLTKSCSSLINFSVITIHPSLTDPVESLFPPGFPKNLIIKRGIFKHQIRANGKQTSVNMNN